MVSVNQISLYKKITDDMLKESKIQIKSPTLTYISEETETIAIDSNIEDSYIKEPQEFYIQVNEFDTMWSPSENELFIEQEIIIEDPSILFGEFGVTSQKNKIGFGCHCYSRTSSFQKTYQCGVFGHGDGTIKLKYSEEFPAASLRGSIYFDFFFYLYEKSEANLFEAKQEGLILSEDNLLTLTLVVDGDGSSFPMSEFSDKEGPLWRLEKKWVDASIDAFDNSSVSLSLNTAHPLFLSLKKEHDKRNRALMGDIMIQAMGMIIQEVIIIEQNNIDDEDLYPGSVLAAVAYWVSTFELDISNLFTIQNSLREKLDRQFIEGESSVND